MEWVRGSHTVFRGDVYIYSCPATKWKVRIGGCLSFVVKVKISRNEPFQMNINKK